MSSFSESRPSSYRHLMGRPSSTARRLHDVLFQTTRNTTTATTAAGAVQVRPSEPTVTTSLHDSEVELELVPSLAALNSDPTTCCDVWNEICSVLVTSNGIVWLTPNMNILVMKNKKFDADQLLSIGYETFYLLNLRTDHTPEAWDVLICFSPRQPSTNAEEETGVAGAVLCWVENAKIELSMFMYCTRESRDVRPLPLSVAQLQNFVRKIPSLQTLYFLGKLRLSAEQCRVLFHDTDRSELEIHYDVRSIIRPLVQALERNDGPSRLTLWRLDLLTKSQLDDLLDVLRSSTVVKVLHFIGNMSHHRVRLIINAIPRMNSLCEIRLPEIEEPYKNDEWNALWEAVGSHQHLESLFLPESGSVSSQERIDRTNVMAHCLRSNVTFTTVRLSSLEIVDLDLYVRNVGPILWNNQYRPYIRAIRSDATTSIRGNAIARALLHTDFQDCASLIYPLLQENRDLLCQLLNNPLPLGEPQGSTAETTANPSLSLVDHRKKRRSTTDPSMGTTRGSSKRTKCQV